MITIHVGDALDKLRELPAESVQTCITSPPYYGLRDYGTAEWEGGDEGCDHSVAVKGVVGNAPSKNSTLTTNNGKGPKEGAKYSSGEASRLYGEICPDCGATKHDEQIGLEETPEQYIAALVAVFREVRRVLHPSGTCWVNLGDSYFSNTATQGRNESKSAISTLSAHGENGRSPSLDQQEPRTYRRESSHYKPKDLMMMPARVALALQADGWWLRSEIIWAKGNPMPESVTDRPTTAHEKIYLLAKSERYFYDHEAIKEPQVSNHSSGNGFVRPQRLSFRDANGARGNADQWEPDGTGRNKRNVWHVNTRPFPESHFATFPPDLVEPMVRAGTSERGCCPECGAPWERMVEIERGEKPPDLEPCPKDIGHNGRGTESSMLSQPGWREWRWKKQTTTGWRATCEHDADPVPCTVLDPFAGAGTTLMVADRLGRDAIGIELSPEYAEMSARRLYDDAGMFAKVEVV